MKVTRIITYEGNPKNVLESLGRSLPDGDKFCKLTELLKISVLTVGNKLLLEVYKSVEEKYALDKEIKECKHEGAKLHHYDYVKCLECGKIKTDSRPEWGIAKNMWFINRTDARFYRDNGRYYHE